MKIKYVTIIVDDMDKSAEFYTKVLKLRKYLIYPAEKLSCLAMGMKQVLN